MNKDTNQFVVRVLLHGAEDAPETYGMLHMEMDRRGFRRFIVESETRYRFPQAEYLYEGAVDRRFVFGLASEAVRAIGWEVGAERAGAHRAAILVTQSAGITFDGLTPLRDDEN